MTWHLPFIERFELKVERPDGIEGCWLWVGCVLSSGYGQFWDGERKVGAHRWSYEHFVGPIPYGLELDHLCRVRNCVNPAHLEPVTRAENHRRGISDEVHRARFLAKTHCPSGHPYSGDNLFFSNTGARKC